MLALLIMGIIIKSPGVYSFINCTGYVDFSQITASKDILFLDSALEDCFTANSYNTMQLPIESYSVYKRLVVEYRFTLNNLLKLDNGGSLSIVTTIGFFWIDENRIWDSSAIKMSKTSVAVEYDSIWTPVFGLAQCESDPCQLVADSSSDVTQDATGKTSLQMIRILSTVCEMDLSKFPFDTQKCTLSFWLMHFTTMQVDMREMNKTLEFFTFQSQEWELVSLYDKAKNFSAKVFM